MLYEREKDDAVRCRLCAHHCLIQPGKRGLCAVRENRKGVLYSLTYGMVISQAVDPIEKKPLFHFLPGSLSYSIAAPGCNFRCSFCQNWQISQLPRLTQVTLPAQTPPDAIVSAARRYRCASISYTYTEPTVFFEYAYEVMGLAHQAGLANVFVTNGYMSPDCLETLRQPDGLLLDAANVDLKAWSDRFYREQCGARLQPVLDSLRLMKKLGIWVEVTTLLIPGLNDDEGELRELAAFLVHDLGSDTPWHVTRFHPDYRLTDVSPTPLSTLERAREIGLNAGLQFVYQGNVPGEGEITYCPKCGAELVRRFGFHVSMNRLGPDGTCPQCATAIPGRWA